MREIVSPLDGFASPFGPQRGFNPLRIFANDEPGVWFEANDANTLFTDVAGTTPVTTPGDAVALQLDKSQGLTLGPELVDLSTATVSDFDGSAGVIDAVNSRFENTSATTSFSTYPRIIWSALLTPGKTYEVDVVAERLTTVGTGGTGGSNVVVSGSFSGKLVAGSNGNIFFGFDGRETFDVAVSISVRELPGNHRTQATTAARPLYALHPVGGVRNELVSTNTLATQDVTVTAAERTLSFKGTGTVTLSGASTAGPLAGTGAEDIVSLTFTPTAGTLTLTVTGTVEEAQLEPGAARTNYQTVGSTFLDVSEEGKARRGRLWYNGTSHTMQTGTITPGTDKVQVFAGVRKLSDAATGYLIEHSSNFASNNGTFALIVPSITTPVRSQFVSKGTSLASIQTTLVGVAPVSQIYTALGDISGDLATLRIDGTQVNQSTGDQGTGNFLAYPIYFGARNGAVLFFNGYEDTSIIRFGPNLDDTTISKVESYVASKTPEPTL